MEKNARIFIAGHRGMVGSAIHRLLEKKGFSQLVLRTSKELDLRNQKVTEEFFNIEKPEYVFLAAAKVGGIVANNTYRADFIYDNIALQTNIIHSAKMAGVKKLLFLGSSCIYPRLAPQPLKEEYLLTGLLEPTNEPYAIAKIAGIKMCDAYRHQYGCNFISAMPTNLYGPNDNFDLETSHVLPALIRKIHRAKLAGDKEVVIWGTGKPLREFLHVDDLAEACLFLMQHWNEPGHINVGSGKEISIADLARLTAGVIGYNGSFVFDTTKPDGTPRKLMDVSRINKLGWKHTIELEQGIAGVYESVKKNLS